MARESGTEGTVKPRLEFIIPGHCVPSERVHKIPFVKGRKADGSLALGVRGVTPGDSAAYMEKVAMFARTAVQMRPEWRTVFARRMPVRVHIHIVRRKWLGDVDNIAKNIYDGLGRSEVVFDNDNRIVQALTSVHTDPQAEERAEILIEPVSGVLEEPLWMRCAREHGWAPERTGT